MALLGRSGKYGPKALMKSILAFIDFSDVTDAVVEITADLARAFNAKLILVHVATPESDYEGDAIRTNISRAGVAGEMHRYHDMLLKLESNYRDAGIDATTLLVRSTSARGKPIRKILQEITRVKPDLIVVGSHGHGLVHKVLLGSVSSAVVRKAPCPVVVVPAGKHCLAAGGARKLIFQLRNHQRSILADIERAPGDFPEISIRIGKISAVAAPEGVLSGLLDRGAGKPGLLEDLVDFRFGSNIVCQCDSSESRAGAGEFFGYVFAQFVVRIDARQTPWVWKKMIPSSAFFVVGNPRPSR